MSSSCALPGQRKGIADEAFDGRDACVEILERLLLAQPRLGDARLGIEHFEQGESALSVALRDRLVRLLRLRDRGLIKQVPGKSGFASAWERVKTNGRKKSALK